MAVKQIVLPNGWKPREYQKGLWRYLRGGGKRAVCAWHRRAGKDDVCLHHTAIAAHQRVGNYWHMLPEYAQARKAIWEAVNPHTGKKRIDEAFPKDLRKFTRENEMIIGFHNGSTWQVVGSDNYDSLMGSTPCGVVMSEFALGNPSAWGYLSPILMENGGWALFISTPRGKNHFHAMLEYAKKKGDGWFAQTLTADETGVFTDDQLEEELARLQGEHGDSYGKSLWLQEYFVSFEAAIPGSIFGEWLDKAKVQGRVGKIEWEKHLPVDTAWDLGRADATAIWFYQFVHGEVHVIDYHESTLKDIDFYADLLRKKPYRYGMHWLPHDARARTLASGGESIYQQLYRHRVGDIAIAKRIDLQDQIQSARKTLPRCWFDEVSCEKGLHALGNYHYEWDEEKRKFSDRPDHDWSSHGASAFMTLSRSWKIPVEKPTESDMMRQILAQNPGSMTFGTAKKRHLSAMRSRRES